MKVKVGGPRSREHTLDIADVEMHGDPAETVLLVIGPKDSSVEDSRPRLSLRFTPADVVQGRCLIAALEVLYGRRLSS